MVNSVSKRDVIPRRKKCPLDGRGHREHVPLPGGAARDRQELHIIGRQDIAMPFADALDVIRVVLVSCEGGAAPGRLKPALHSDMSSSSHEQQQIKGHEYGSAVKLMSCDCSSGTQVAKGGTHSKSEREGEIEGEGEGRETEGRGGERERIRRN